MKQKRHDGVSNFLSKHAKPSHVKPLKRWHGEFGIETSIRKPDETVAVKFSSGLGLVAHLNDKGKPNWRFQLIEDLGGVCRVEAWYGWEGRGIRSANANDLERLLINSGWDREQFAIDTLEVLTVREVVK